MNILGENANAEWELCQQELTLNEKKKGKTARNDASHDVATATDESGFPISCQKNRSAHGYLGYDSAMAELLVLIGNQYH